MYGIFPWWPVASYVSTYLPGEGLWLPTRTCRGLASLSVDGAVAVALFLVYGISLWWWSRASQVSLLSLSVDVIVRGRFFPICSQNFA